MSKWSDRWNELPYEIRHIGSMTDAELRINQLLIEKARLKKRYTQSCDEINAHIKNLRDWLTTEGGTISTFATLSPPHLEQAEAQSKTNTVQK